MRREWVRYCKGNTGAYRSSGLHGKSCNALAAFMGAAKAGCFYCLLDPAQPVERIQMILATLGAEIMIIDEKSAKKQEKLGFSGKVLKIEELLEHTPDEKK